MAGNLKMAKRHFTKKIFFFLGKFKKFQKEKTQNAKQNEKGNLVSAAARVDMVTLQSKNGRRISRMKHHGRIYYAAGQKTNHHRPAFRPKRNSTRNDERLADKTANSVQCADTFQSRTSKTFTIIIMYKRDLQI